MHSKAFCYTCKKEIKETASWAGLERAEVYWNFRQWWKVKHWRISATEKEKKVWGRDGGWFPCICPYPANAPLFSIRNIRNITRPMVPTFFDLEQKCSQYLEGWHRTSKGEVAHWGRFLGQTRGFIPQWFISCVTFVGYFIFWASVPSSEMRIAFLSTPPLDCCEYKMSQQL